MQALLAVLILLSGGLAKSQGENVDILDLGQVNLEEDGLEIDNIESKSGSELDKNGTRVEEILEPLGDYKYSSFGRSDPFSKPSKSVVEPIGNESKLSDTEIPMISPLQAYPLEELQVKGVWIHKNGDVRAIVMTPKKEGIIIKKGDPISAGKVINITRQKILVRQYQLRIDGTREYTDLEIPIGTTQNREIGKIRLQPGKDAIFQVNENLEKINPIRTRQNVVPAGVPQQPADGMEQQGVNDPMQQIDNELPPAFNEKGKQTQQPPGNNLKNDTVIKNENGRGL